MQLPGGSEIWFVGLALLIPSVFAALCYALVRTLEKGWRAFPYVALTLLGLFYIGFLAVYFEFNTAFFFGLTLLPAAVSGYFHRRAGGASRSFGVACLVMLFNFWLNAVVCSVVGGIIWVFTQSFTPISATVYSYAALGYPVLAPLALWIWQSLRLRPGFDEVLRDGEAVVGPQNEPRRKHAP